MKLLWLINTLIGFAGTGILTYFFLFSEINPFLAGMILNICVSYFTLSFSNYIFVCNSNGTKKIEKFGLPLISIVAFTSLCVSILFPIYFKHLWNITLILHILTFGVGLFQLIPKSATIMSKISKAGLLFCVLCLSLLIMLELETPLFYSTIGVILFIESLLILLSILLNKAN